jgi:hypothetical protein
LIARAETIVTVEKDNDGMPKDHAVFLRLAAHSILEKLRIVEASGKVRVKRAEK